MNERFDSKSLWWMVWILGAILLVKILWVTVAWWVPLPVVATPQKEHHIKHSLHYRYRLASDVKIEAPAKKASTKTKAVPRVTLASYQLVAIYSRTDYAVVTLVRGTKSFFLSSAPGGGEVEGYHLKDANASSARFQKGKTITTLKLYEKNAHSRGVASAIQAVQSKPQPKPPAKKSEQPIVDVDGTKRIDRSLIRSYSEHPEKIWKNIGLYEVKSEGRLDGFKVRFVRRGSPFEKLGLKRGDIIKSINGEPIVDYATPMRMLRSADTIDDLSITIERNHEEQELKYEVK